MAMIFTAKYFFNCACRDLGLEEPHTIAIGKIMDKVDEGKLDADHANDLAKLLYNDGRLLKYAEDFEDEGE